MRVVMWEAYGGPADLVVKSVGRYPAHRGQATPACPVSYTDVLRIAGQYHVKTPPPFIPGGEVAGEIPQLGADVRGWKVGDRVLCGGSGFAEESTAGRQPHPVARYDKLRGSCRVSLQLHDRLLRVATRPAASRRDPAGARRRRRRWARHGRHGQEPRHAPPSVSRSASGSEPTTWSTTARASGTRSGR